MLKRSLLCFILAGTLLIIACASPSSTPKSSQPSATASPKLVIVPISGVSATKINVYGSGFISGEKVRVMLVLGDADMVMGAENTGGIVKVNEFGAFTLTPGGGIPTTQVLKPGVYTVQAIGDKGSRASSPLEILEKK